MLSAIDITTQNWLPLELWERICTLALPCKVVPPQYDEGFLEHPLPKLPGLALQKRMKRWTTTLAYSSLCEEVFTDLFLPPFSKEYTFNREGALAVLKNAAGLSKLQHTQLDFVQLAKTLATYGICIAIDKGGSLWNVPWQDITPTINAQLHGCRSLTVRFADCGLPCRPPRA